MDTAVDVALILFILIVLAGLLRSIRRQDRLKREQDQWHRNEALTVVGLLSRIADALERR